MSKIIVTGGGGFIGHHLIKYLKQKDNYVIGVDIKYPDFEETQANEFIIQDLRCIGYEEQYLMNLFYGADEVYHLAADMGGIGYIETHKADIVFNNTMINMLTLKACKEQNVKKFLFTSSACVYPKCLQNTQEVKKLQEENAYPADCEDGYGWEKLMMERTCRHFREDYGLKTYIARLHNIYGPLGTYDGGKEKSPAALCRKVALAKKNDTIQIWGNGNQVRSYCYVDDCIEALYLLMQSDYYEPINIGTDRAISIDELVDIIINLSGKTNLKSYFLSKPQGVKSRNANITKAKEILNWQPKVSLEDGLDKTYQWIYNQIYQ